jgi:hypothetical protein
MSYERQVSTEQRADNMDAKAGEHITHHEEEKGAADVGNSMQRQAAEKSLLRKLDALVLPLMSLSYLLAYMASQVIRNFDRV